MPGDSNPAPCPFAALSVHRASCPTEPGEPPCWLAPERRYSCRISRGRPTAPIPPPAGSAPPAAARSRPCATAVSSISRPIRDHPYSKGAFCIKGIRGAPGITYRPEPPALSHAPHRRARRGQWARISWDEALEEMAERLAAGAPEIRAGGDRRRHQRRLFQPQPILALMLRSIGSPNWMINQDLCGGCRAVSARATGPRHHARRGHRQHALRADRRPQPEHRRSRGMGRAEGRQEARRAHHRHRSQAHAGGADGRPVAAPRASAPMRRWRSP